MEKLNVIEKLEESTDWVDSMVTINGNLRICINPHDLNKTVKHDYYPMSTVEGIVTKMLNTKVF